MSEGSASGRCVCCAFACAVCKILCFTCCRRVCSSEPAPSPKPEYAVLCVGLEGAGKSTLLACAAGEDTSDIEPTNGFAIKALLMSRAVLNVKELGGSDKIRPYWDKYYSGHEAIVFVVDSCCSEEELTEAEMRLEHALGDSALSATPLLVLCSKQDHTNARPVNKIQEKLQLQEKARDRPHIVQGCSTQDIDGLINSFELLVDMLLPES